MRNRLSTRISAQNPAGANQEPLAAPQNDPGPNVEPTRYKILPVDGSPYSGLDLDAALAD